MEEDLMAKLKRFSEESEEDNKDQKQIYVPKCPSCNDFQFLITDYRSGDTVCKKCSIVLRDRVIDFGAEWRDFESDTGDGVSKSRASKTDGFIEELTTEIKGRSKMAGTQSKIALSQKNKTLQQGFSKISQFSDILQLPESIRSTCKGLYKQFEQDKTKGTKGNKTDATVCAIIYMACKREHVARTIKEIAKETDVNEKEITRFYRLVSKVIPQEVSERTTAASLIIRFTDALKIPFEYVAPITSASNKAETFVEGRNPRSIAAGVIVLVLKETKEARSEKDVSVIADISAATIRVVMKELSPHANQILPYDFINSHKK